MAKILITGGSGMVGRRITAMLREAGHDVAWLSRKEGERDGVRSYRWDIEEGFIDPKAFAGVQHIIHLAGAGIIGKRWTRRYREEMFDSRVRSAELLYRHLRARNIRLESYTGASAVGYYGAAMGDHVCAEDDKPGRDFLAKLCVAWEKSHFAFSVTGIRTTVIRTAVVLGREGGALKKMFPFFRAGLGAALAPGSQHFPWIHIDDIARVYVAACLDQEMNGVFNAAAPHVPSNLEFSAALATACGTRLWLPNIPAFLLRMVFGEAATTLTKGAAVSSRKLQSAGFEFNFDRLDDALRHLAGAKAT